MIKNLFKKRSYILKKVFRYYVNAIQNARHAYLLK